MEVRAANVREGAFTAHATKFFVGLERDNSKDYWTANKAIFENEVKEPMAALVGTVYLRASGRARIDGGLRRVHDDARSAGAVWEAVAADGTGRALEDILRDLTERDIEVGHGMTEPLKTAPRGYPKDHPRVDLLRQKAVSAHRKLSGTPLRDAATVRQFVVDTFDACGPMNDWIKSNVGSAQTGSGRR
jgi:uncharacterized protein (DUF2461 family)